MENEVKNEVETTEEKNVEVENETVEETKKVETKEITETPKEEVSTKRKGHGPLYWIIVIVGVALIVYLSIGIGEKLGKLATTESGNGTTKEESNSNTGSNVEESNNNDQSNVVENSNSNVSSNSSSNTTNPEEAKDPEITNFNATNATTELNTYLGYALLYDGELSENNLLENENFRKNVVISSLTSAKPVEGQTNEMYVEYTEFDKKHQEIFGTNYQTKTEITDGKVLWSVEEIAIDDVLLTAKAIKYNESTKTYVITGEWKQKQTGGNFAVEYNLSNGNRYLKSVKLGHFNSQF